MIKGWMSSSEVKDKDMLSDRRRLIEQQMERFKAVERETKTKAFSKTGLTAEQKMDPKEREREELRNWLSDCIDRIGQQNDQFEAEIEVIESNSGKKKKLDKEVRFYPFAHHSYYFIHLFLETRKSRQLSSPSRTAQIPHQTTRDDFTPRRQ